VAVRRAPIAVGGMLFGSIYTLFRMRKALPRGCRGIRGIPRTVARRRPRARKRYMSSKVVISLIFGVSSIHDRADTPIFQEHVIAGIVAAVVMLIVGFSLRRCRGTSLA